MRVLAAGLAALSFLFVAPACARTPPASESAAPVNPALFVARDEDSAIYLFGTVHVRRPGSAWGGENAQRALAEADEVWTELEMSPGADAEAARLMFQYGAAPTDQPLSSLLTAAENARLAEVAQGIGLTAATFEGMRPWFAGLMLAVWPMMQAGYDPQAGVDRAVDEIADAAGKRRRAFETMEQQVGFLAGMSMDAQMEMLREALAETQKNPMAEFDAMTRAWEQGDLDTLERYVIDDTREEYPEMYEVMFVQRNDAWIDMLMREMEGSGVDFVAVGAGHLLGGDGLVEQLRARGVRVERVSPAE